MVYRNEALGEEIRRVVERYLSSRTRYFESACDSSFIHPCALHPGLLVKSRQGSNGQRQQRESLNGSILAFGRITDDDGGEHEHGDFLEDQEPWQVEVHSEIEVWDEDAGLKGCVCVRTSRLIGVENTRPPEADSTS
jgi:hypothetical protein